MEHNHSVVVRGCYRCELGMDEEREQVKAWFQRYPDSNMSTSLGIVFSLDEYDHMREAFYAG